MGRYYFDIVRLRVPAVILGTWLLVAAGPTGVKAAGETEESSELVNRYLDASRAQQEVLRGVQMEVDIDAKIPKLEKRGRFRALRRISRLGRITYKALGFSGDDSVKNEVITRYLSAESDARNSGAIAITPANYKFKYRGKIDRNGRQVAILQVTPRKKAIGLFKGELWVDLLTGMPVRESGSFVKNPSVFLKKIEFVRDYEMRDGMAFPKHIESMVNTRLVGRAELSINYSNFSKQENAEDDLFSASTGQ
jgi:hypothetical protein